MLMALGILFSRVLFLLFLAKGCTLALLGVWLGSIVARVLANLAFGWKNLPDYPRLLQWMPFASLVLTLTAFLTHWNFFALALAQAVALCDLGAYLIWLVARVIVRR